MKKKLLISALLAMWLQVGFAQEGDHLISWAFKFDQKDLKAGDEVPFTCSAKIDKDWKLYVSDYDVNYGIKSIEFEFAENGTFGVIKPVLPIIKVAQNECSQNNQLQNIAEKIAFRSIVRIEENKFEVSGVIRGQLYHEKSGQLISFQQKFVIK